MQTLTENPQNQVRLTKDTEALYLYLNDFEIYVKNVFRILNPNTPLVDSWTIRCLAEYLEAIRAGQLKKLIINIPPRFLKSTIANIGFSSWLLGHQPNKRIIVASHSDSLARSQSILTRDVMRSNFYKKLFPNTSFKDDQDTQKEFTTTKGGQRIATSIGGNITGKGADILILDDPNDVNQAISKAHLEQVIYYYTNVLYTRLNDKKTGAIINIQQRCNVNDLTGYLLEADKQFELLKLPIQFEKDKIISIGKFKKEVKAGDLLNENRESAEVIAQTQATLGNIAFAGQYMQTPVAAEGNLFRESWLKKHDKYTFDKIFQSWDTAVKTNQMNDFSVCTTWGVEGNEYYLLDLYRGKLEFPELKNMQIALANKWNATQIIIEDKASGQGLLQTLRKETRLPIVAYMPDKDKVTRWSKAAIHFEAGRVYFPEKHFVKDIIEELKTFPNGLHDDIVDSISQFLNWYNNKPKAEVIVL
jgi:predicted phage terminase large subunit-like protein